MVMLYFSPATSRRSGLDLVRRSPRDDLVRGGGWSLHPYGRVVAVCQRREMPTLRHRISPAIDRWSM